MGRPIKGNEISILGGTTWYVNDYVVNGKTVLIHRLIMDAHYEMEVDHRDGNKLNNRVKNLRVCVRKNNAMNLGIRKDNISGVTGVGWHKRDCIWEANIRIDNKTIYLGRDIDKDKAIKLRKDAELKYFGEYARG